MTMRGVLFKFPAWLGCTGPIGFDGLVRKWCSSGSRPTAPARMGIRKCGSHGSFAIGSHVPGRVGRGWGPGFRLADRRDGRGDAGSFVRSLARSLASLTRAGKDGALVEGTCPRKAGRRCCFTAWSDAGSIPAGSMACWLTAFVSISDAALFLDEGVVLRSLALIVAAFAVVILLVPGAQARRAHGSYAVASAYSAEATGSTRQGCAGAPPLRDAALSVATYLIGCGQRMRVCYGHRCVIVTRWDSGPGIAGRQIDLNLGVVRRFGFLSCNAWGVRTVTWSRA